MPFVTHAGAQIHWSELGRGEPVLLVMGLGCSSAMWFRLAPRLARRHRVILVDNRGSGQTRAHQVVYRVPTMAADLAAVLDAAEVERTHLVGFSMGGMLAQQFALDHGSRVGSLALLATSCGGLHARWAEPEVRARLFSKGDQSPEEEFHAMRPFTYAAATPEPVVEEDCAVRVADAPTLRGYRAQLYSLLGWTSYSDLPRIRAATLVMHGLEDRLIPPENGRLLAGRIAKARLLELPQASHWLTSDQPDAAANALLAHFEANRMGARA